MRLFKNLPLSILLLSLFVFTCGDGGGSSRIILPKEYNNNGNMVLLYHKKGHIYIEEINPAGSLVWKYTMGGEYEFSDELYEFSLFRMGNGMNVVKTPNGSKLLEINRDGDVVSELNIENLTFPDKYRIKNICGNNGNIFISLEPVSEFSRWRVVGLDEEYEIFWQYMVFEDWAYMVECGGETVQYNVKSIDGTIDTKIFPIQSISFDEDGNVILYVDALRDIDATEEVDKNYVGPRFLFLKVDMNGNPINHLGYDDVGASPGHNPIFSNLHRINPIEDGRLLFVGADSIGIFDEETDELEILKEFPDCYPLGYLGNDKFILNAYLFDLAGYRTVIVGTNRDIKRYKGDEVDWEYRIDEGTILDFQVL